jgi:hypothetical protein
MSRSLSLLSALLLVITPSATAAQGAADTSDRVAVLDVALYNAGANVQEAIDTAMAVLADEVLRGKLAELLPGSLVDSSAVRRVGASDSAMAITGNKPCNVIVACTRYVGSELGAEWAVMSKVSKTSNLIWLFTGQLIDVRSGEILMDDSIELKGDPDPMVRAGTRNFAERVARTIKQGAVSSR